jgi:hypothetical protein
MSMGKSMLGGDEFGLMEKIAKKILCKLILVSPNKKGGVDVSIGVSPV